MFTRARWIRLVCASVVLLPCITGCFRKGPELAPVTGTVTLDGEPLEGAQVEFKPMQGNPSYGTTNGAGGYVLKFTKDKVGAVVGTHVVRITTQTTSFDESGKEIQVPERVPERYNYRSELIREVRPRPNRRDFVLWSTPQTEEGKAEEGEGKEAEAKQAEAGEPEKESPAEKAKPDEPVLEGPKLEVPKTDEPKTDEPKPEEPTAKAAEASDVQLAPVTGIVTLDGEPLANAVVEFRPDDGSPSFATTDAKGHYDLTYTPDQRGALLGRHVVRITTRATTKDAEGNDVAVPERLPPTYNARSALMYEVVPGRNTVDFPLTSAPLEELAAP